MYADRVTDSMQAAMDETTRRRKIQIAYNKEHILRPKLLSNQFLRPFRLTSRMKMISTIEKTICRN